MNISVMAAGDSYNDMTMIKAADAGALFCPPESIVRENPEIAVAKEYSQLDLLVDRFLAGE